MAVNLWECDKGDKWMWLVLCHCYTTEQQCNFRTFLSIFLPLFGLKSLPPNCIGAFIIWSYIAGLILHVWRMVADNNIWRVSDAWSIASGWGLAGVRRNVFEITGQAQCFKIRLNISKSIRQTQFSMIMRQTCIMSGIVYVDWNSGGVSRFREKLIFFLHRV